MTVHSRLLNHKYDWRVLTRLVRIFRRTGVDAVITVGCGDKMFWGRLAAWRARVPVVLSALHSTGWPDGVGRLNRCLDWCTDGYIAVARAHARHLSEVEGFPRHKVHVIANGVDTERFSPAPGGPGPWRQQLGFTRDTPLVVILAALRSEKNHRRFLRVVQRVAQSAPLARYLVVGDGPLRAGLESYARELGIDQQTHFLGNRQDVPALLRACDLAVLTSDNEAAPVSILEAQAAGLPVVAPRVGSIPEMVRDGVDGFVVAADAEPDYSARILQLLQEPAGARRMGFAGRQRVESRASLPAMVAGYTQLVETLYRAKTGPGICCAQAISW